VSDREALHGAGGGVHADGLGVGANPREITCAILSAHLELNPIAAVAR